jgi:Zn-dependent protease/CBS domain-containing protein
LIAWSLALGYFPMAGESANSPTYWVLGAIAALLLFASVLVHELGHSFVARSRGLRVDNITLFIFGGVSNITRDASTAKDEFLISVVGPAISFVLAAAFWSIGQLLPVGSAEGAIAGYLASANLLLGLFNIVPGFPLDGGRVLRSALWALTGNMLRATQVATYVGQAIAYVLIGWGVLQVLGGDVFGGLWIGFIGWFLNSGAEASRQQATAESALAQVPITTVMDSSQEHVSPALMVNDFVLEHVVRRHRRALPVVDAGRLVGIMSVTDAEHLNQNAWATTNVGAVMTRMPLKTLGPDANVAAAMQLMVDNDLHQLPIVLNEELLGSVSRADVMRAMQSGFNRTRPETEPIGFVPDAPKTVPSHG